jgi:hypothetical protein
VEVLIALPFVAYAGEVLAEKILKPGIKVISKLFPGVDQEAKDYVEGLVCMIPGAVICYLAGLDMFEAIGIPLAGVGGPVLTAIIAGRGANLVHDLLAYLDQLRGAA